MKKTVIFFEVFIASLFGFSSCEKEGAKQYEVNIKVNYPDGYLGSKESDILVSILNTTSALEDTIIIDETGVGKVYLGQGNFTISGSTETADFYFNGTTQDLVVLNTINSFEINLEASSKKSGLVFKEIYYTGSLTPTSGKYYSDQFHEIYNNGNETIYIDGLCIGLLQSSGATACPWVDELGNIQDSLPIIFHALMFPGTGQDHPLAPGESIVLAQDGINHKSDPVNGNPNSPVDLGNAQFETYIEAPGKDTDAAGAENLIVMYTTSSTSTDWLHPITGYAIVLFFLPTGLDYESYVTDPHNFQTVPGSTSQVKYLMVDKSCVLDAVEIVNPDESKRYKRLPVSLDAGMINCSSSYIGKSIRRKVLEIVDGKVVYKDTNNSSNDFIGDCTPTPFIQPSQVD